MKKLTLALDTDDSSLSELYGKNREAVYFSLQNRLTNE
jgi:hypothetical protein